MGWQDITDCLDSWLATMPGVPPINFENTVDGYAEGTTWVRVTHIPNTVDGASIGRFSDNKWKGIFNLNVLVPSNSGSRISAPIIDALISRFKRGSEIPTPAGNTVQIEKVTPGSAMKEKSWYVIPINIRYYCFEQNT